MGFGGFLAGAARRFYLLGDMIRCFRSLGITCDKAVLLVTSKL